MTNETIFERIKLFVNFKDITIRKFETRCNLYNGFSSKAKSINAEQQAAIHAAYPDLNMAWLLTGQGSMISNVEQTSITIDASDGKHDSHDIYNASGSHAVAGRNIHMNDSELKKENEDLRKKLDEANKHAHEYLRQIKELQDELLSLYRNSFKK